MEDESSKLISPIGEALYYPVKEILEGIPSANEDDDSNPSTVFFPPIGFLFVELGHEELCQGRSWTIVVGEIRVEDEAEVGEEVFDPNLHIRKPKDKADEWPRAGSSVSCEGEDDIITKKSLQFDFDEIRAATNNFSNENKLGKGGFGAVYKGELSNGQVVAVKRLSRNSGQGDTEFKNEIILVAKLQHRNLVRLLGFCLEGEEKLIIYEFMPNTSLDRFIFDPDKDEKIDWEMRYRIIEGIARGLLYLHQDSRLKIIHRDIKASNILLDEEMNPKIADFGMARHFVDEQTEDNTNRVVGTYGYMAPEYVMHGKFSVKTDVFSFGVLILEIVSGQRNNSFHQSEQTGDLRLISHAWRHWREDTTMELLDPSLRENCQRSEVIKCIQIGLLCVQELSSRPTMASVILMLSSDSANLPVPKPPVFFMRSQINQGIPFMKHDLKATESGQSTSTRTLPSITEMYPR
ncbi:putative receptor-like protein kinase At4g00960 [Telopea speciosissima]|uniref:putative receptor-like protein kinase At4g00960 n=1 Tax=Telopea speciosissima TaxID=54955 RepID=UPI001CC5381C|nr:putative receptor-like protein kinase At4g00960 [Telopea speciosissima]